MARLVTRQLRCFCARHPLLAVYGINKQGKLFVHIKIWKQGRIYGEVLVTSGVVQLHCRECLRWQKVVIRQPEIAVLEVDEEPAELATNAHDLLLADVPSD